MSKPSVTSFTLKVVAIAGMTSNHVANIFALQMPGWLTVALCSFGGLTFPIMAFLLCEGYRHTSNIGRYAGRLGVFAVVSQVPYSLLWGATANVLVTLLIGLGILWMSDHAKSGLAFAGSFAAGLVASAWCDWGIIGPLMIYLFHRLHGQGARGVALTMLVAFAALALPAVEGLATLQVESPWDALAQLPAVGMAALEGGTATAGALGATVLDGVRNTVEAAGPLVNDAGALGYAVVGFGLAGLLLTKYNGRRGRPLKWFFYLYYPAHLMALWGIAQFLQL